MDIKEEWVKLAAAASKHVWDKWPTGIDTTNVEAVRAAAAKASIEAIATLIVKEENEGCALAAEDECRSGDAPSIYNNGPEIVARIRARLSK